MTILIRNDIILNENTGRYNNHGVKREKIKDVVHQGRVLEFINTTETTADKPWCDIKFIDEDQIYTEMYHRIKLK